MNEYNLNNQIDFFNNWKENMAEDEKGFITDGIIDFNEWNKYKKCNKQILFLLKEAYSDEPNEKWDLREHIKSNKFMSDKGNVWNRVAEWTEGLLKTTKDSIFSYDKLKKENSGNWLQKIAIVNLKKSNGNNCTNMEELSEYVNKHKDRLKNQIIDINPDIIVCGYTFDLFRKIFNEKDYINELGNTISNSAIITINNKKTIVINYYHPANRYPKVLNYYGLLGIYQEILKNEL